MPIISSSASVHALLSLVQTGCWSGAILTVALVSAAILQKSRQNMTLHDAVLVLNFITLSSVASIAVAPMSDIWRQSPRSRHSLTQSSSPNSAVSNSNPPKDTEPRPGPSTPDPNSSRLSIADGMHNGSEGSSRSPLTAHLPLPDPYHHQLPFEETHAAPSDNGYSSQPAVASHELTAVNGAALPHKRHRTVTGRGILSLSLLAQVLLQWVWAVYMFVSPRYSQPWCNGQTTLFIFLHRVKVSKIRGWTNLTNSTGLPSQQTHYTASIIIWPAWLAFCLFWPTAYVVLLVLRASEISDDDYWRLSLSRRATLTDVDMPAPVQSSGDPAASLRMTRRTPSAAAKILHRIIPQSFRRVVGSTLRRLRRALQFIWRFMAPPFLLKSDKKRRICTMDSGIWLANLIAMLVVIIFVVSSELQLYYNCLIRTGSPWGFGQIAAVLFALAPCWALADIIHNRLYPPTSMREQYHRRHEELIRPSHMHARTDSNTPLLRTPGGDEDSSSSVSPGITLHSLPLPSN
ncbi:hypothetical protein DL93DRAFT_922417 [Clavulina sp. PMI_390]|nr:hypothetical protein DL93DRAFT_922417 [Clavulina sp. PMI_390]